MTARTLSALVLALALLCPPFPAQAAEQEAADGWAVRRKVLSPGEADGSLPPAQQQLPPPAANATAPLALPEPPLPREPAKNLPGKPLAPAATTPSAPAQPRPATPSKAPAQTTTQTAAPQGAPTSPAPAGPPSTQNMVSPPKRTPPPTPDAPASIRPAPPKTVLRKGAASVSVRRTAEDLIVTLTTGGQVDFETFFLENPSRMIVDIAGDWTIRGQRELAVGSHGCKSVRLGRHENRLRAVFDLDPGSVYRSETSRTDKGLQILFSR